MVHYISPTTGTIIKKTIRDILGTHARDSAFSIFGFGSFFRGEPFNDVDLLFVFFGSTEDIITATARVSAICGLVENYISVPVHFLLLTEREFDEQPLRDMDQLQPLS
jgi:hypothetical protein